MTARVSMLLKSRASRDMLPFSLYNKKRLAIRHMNRPIFPMTLSIPSDIGEYVGLRTYQHPLVFVCVCVVPWSVASRADFSRISYLHNAIACTSAMSSFIQVGPKI